MAFFSLPHQLFLVTCDFTQRCLRFVLGSPVKDRRAHAPAKGRKAVAACLTGSLWAVLSPGDQEPRVSLPVAKVPRRQPPAWILLPG